MNNEDKAKDQSTEPGQDSGPMQQKKSQKEEREIVIKTDGDTARIEKAEVAGKLELKAILQGLANNF